MKAQTAPETLQPALPKLNAEQRSAVEHAGGPLLIVAGAGTGKTRVLVERIGYLLRRSPAVPPSGIVALTFAREAAAEMRHRAIAQFGRLASRCTFSTFHAFGQHLLGNAPRRAVDKIDQWIFLRRHLEELDLNHYFKVSEPGRFLQDLVDFCSRCHDNLVSPADYSAYVRKLESEFQAGSEQCSEEEIDRQKEVARVFTLLEELQDREGLLSFGGMISRAIQFLDSAPDMLVRLQRRYQHILVDEFQDTNTAQFELLVRLAGKRRNLTVVGDDDQAIYRFRGASFASFEQFARAFPEHQRIVLDLNYRSTKRILAVASASIAANSQDRYQPGKKLRTSNADGPPPEIWEFTDAAAEADYTARKIAEEVREGTAAAYSEFAVLYRSHHLRDSLVRALKRHGVPFAIRHLSLNALPLTRDLVAYLRVIGEPRDSVSLARVLTDPRWQLTPEMLISYCEQAAKRRLTLGEMIEQPNLTPNWSGRDEFLYLCSRFRNVAREQKLLNWFALLLHDLDFPRCAEDRYTLTAFEKFLDQWDEEKSKTRMLAEFLEYFGYFEEAGGSIGADDDWASADGELETGSVDADQAAFWDPSPDERRGKVQLMTMHGAKGLEFERVIVWHALARTIPTSNRTPLIELPAALWKGPLPQGDFHIEEERRLFYVALTRARSQLVISTISNARQKPSRFVTELESVPSPELVRRRPVLARPAVGEHPEAISRLAEWAAAPVPRPPGELTLSVSQIDAFRTCPLKYHFQRNWHVPSPVTPAMLFGTIVHAAVKEVVYTLVHQPERLSPVFIAEVVERRWSSVGFSDPVQERKYRQMAVEHLAALQQVWSSEKLQLLQQEMPFDLLLGGCKLVGRLDQVHRNRDGHIELVEYKTGAEQTQKDADRSLQLTLYALACREVLQLDVQGLVLYYLGTQARIRTTRTEQDFTALEKTVREVRQEILAGRFPAKPGYHCRFCGYRPLCPAQEESLGIPSTSPSEVATAAVSSTNEP